MTRVPDTILTNLRQQAEFMALGDRPAWRALADALRELEERRANERNGEAHERCSEG